MAASGSAGLCWSCLLERALRGWCLGDASVARGYCYGQENPKDKRLHLQQEQLLRTHSGLAGGGEEELRQEVCWKHHSKPLLEALPCSSSENHLEGLLKCRFLGPIADLLNWDMHFKQAAQICLRHVKVREPLTEAWADPSASQPLPAGEVFLFGFVILPFPAVGTEPRLTSQILDGHQPSKTREGVTRKRLL